MQNVLGHVRSVFEIWTIFHVGRFSTIRINRVNSKLIIMPEFYMILQHLYFSMKVLHVTE